MRENMSTEDEIASRLLQGYTPIQLINEGFKKSTVYKINQEIKARLMQTTRPEWMITNINPLEPRALPKQTRSLSFQFENTSGKDMYLYKVGISTEWMENNTWIAQDVKDLIKPGQKRFFSFLLSVPDNIALGEYSMAFGVEMQYLPANEYQPLQTQWTEPMVFHVKEPFRNIRIFLSHSTKDMTLVLQLEKQLDNYGIKVDIAEERKSPGAELKQKFESLIRECNIFVALLTEEGANSQWVQHETDYAKQISKPVILLKEQNVPIRSDYEWVSFSRNDPPEILLKKIMDAINQVHGVARGGIDPVGAILGIGILALLLGIAFGGDR
jgi:hypothetical protein